MSKLDPQVEALLEQLKEHAAQQPAPMRPETAGEKIAATRLMFKSFGAFGLPSEPVLRVDDFDLPGLAEKIPLRLYIPVTETPLRESTPLLLYYHGGGFVAGDLDGHDTLLRAIANRAGCLILSVDYRLAPENPYPAANDDALAALNWVVDHGLEIGADPERLAVGGDSAGGLLAAWVAQRANENGVNLRLQVLLYPCLDATASSASWAELGTGEYIISRTQMLEWYDAYLPEEINRTDPRISPLFATDLAGIAPALIVTADHDPLHDEGDEYADKLKLANVQVDHTCWPGMIHGVASLAGVLDAGKSVIDHASMALRNAFAMPGNAPTEGTQSSRGSAQRSV
jgi:acetyl esterase